MLLTSAIFFLDLVILCVCVFCLHECMYMHHVCTWFLQRSEEGINLLDLGLETVEVLCGCWELNLDPMQEQELLTSVSSLQPLFPVLVGLFALIFFFFLRQDLIQPGWPQTCYVTDDCLKIL